MLPQHKFTALAETLRVERLHRNRNARFALEKSRRVIIVPRLQRAEPQDRRRPHRHTDPPERPEAPVPAAGFAEKFQHRPLHFRVQHIEHRPDRTAVDPALFAERHPARRGCIERVVAFQHLRVVGRMVNHRPIHRPGLYHIVAQHIVESRSARLDRTLVDIHFPHQRIKPQQREFPHKTDLFAVAAGQQFRRPVCRGVAPRNILAAVVGNRDAEHLRRFPVIRKPRAVIPAQRIHQRILAGVPQIGENVLHPLRKVLRALARLRTAGVLVLHAEVTPAFFNRFRQSEFFFLQFKYFKTFNRRRLILPPGHETEREIPEARPEQLFKLLHRIGDFPAVAVPDHHETAAVIRVAHPQQMRAFRRQAEPVAEPRQRRLRRLQIAAAPVLHHRDFAAMKEIAVGRIGIGTIFSVNCSHGFKFPAA